ncbi:MAG TPA: glycosyltransferase family 4 protein [Longimicrobium sp.]|nr:glycosyltransferase family 4 protein [Longimicrobium sp.]
MSRPDSLLLVGPLPPPYYGQSVSFGMLVREVDGRGIPHRVVDLAHGEKSAASIGRATWSRARDYAGILARFARAVPGGRKTLYLTIAQSRHGFFRDCVMIWLAALCRQRIVVHLKGGNYHNFYADQPRPLRALVRATLRRAHRVLVLGERLRSMFDFEPALADRIRVVSNGLPEDRLEGAGPRRLPASPAEGPVRLLYLSNLIESKGWLDLLAAVKLLRDRLGEGVVRCDFYGLFMTNADDRTVRSAEHARQLFDGYVAEHRLEDSVGFHGVVAGDEKRQVLARSHFFVLPTRYNNEGQPVSIIEAIAYGNVVVSTDYRAIPDMVVDGVTGCLVPYGDAEAIAGAVEALVRSPERYAEMSRAAVEHYERRFTRRAHLDALLPHLLDAEPALSPAPAAERLSTGPRPSSPRAG